MLRWPMAANEPSAIEAIETKTTICCHSCVMPGNATTVARTKMAMAATFGAPTPVTAFFASAPKVAAIAIFVRATIIAFPGIVHEWQQIVAFVAIASMALGSFAAIGQRNIKRLMAYSSIGHMGFALVGLAAGTPEGVQGVVIYMSIYLAMTLGTFAVILTMRRGGKAVEQISDLAG